MKKILPVLALFCLSALAQQPKAASAQQPKAASALPPGVTISDPSYPFPLEERDKIRDLQHEYDQIEIENQKMLVKIEQNKARQSSIVDAEKLAAFKFSEAKKINLDLYDFDPAPISFVKKKKP